MKCSFIRNREATNDDGQDRTGFVMRITLTLLALVVLSKPASADPPRRPNVLFIVADDLNNDLGCYGHPIVQSPAIDRLAKHGVRFDRGYCQYPVCNPSRVSFLSGLRPEATRIIDLPTPTRSHLGAEYVFLPQFFRRNGYRAVKIGKIYHTGDRHEDPASWDVDIRESADAKNPPKERILSRMPFAGSSTNSEFVGISLQGDDHEAYDGRLARKGAEELETLARGTQPFFLAVGFRRPHTPYIAPQRYFDLYPPEKLPLPTEPADHLDKLLPVALTYGPHDPRPTAEESRVVRAAYYASITYLDAQVAVLLDAMDRLGLWEETIVVLISDHGYHLGEHGGMWHKMSLFEQSCRVPMLIAAPRQARGESCPRTVEMIDLYPTLLELAGFAVPKHLQGASLVPLLRNPTQAWSRPALTVVSRDQLEGRRLGFGLMGRSLRTERFRYTEWDEGRKGVELYDHDHDPEEYMNLAADPRYADVVADLQRRLRSLVSDGR